MRKGSVYVILILILLTTANSLSAENVIMVTDYNKGFSDWKVKEFKGKAVYEVKKLPEREIVLKSNKTSFSLAKELVFNLSEYPYLNFSWKVSVLPENGDVRNEKTDDQAAQIYVILPSFPEMINFKAIGYIWDSKAPEGIYQSKKSSNIKYVVLKTGKADAGRWHSEKVNVYQDFKRLWNIDVKKRKVVVSLSIDSDDTKSSSKSAFGEIFFSQK